MYMPMILDGRLAKSWDLGEHTAELWTELEAKGGIGYLFLLSVVPRDGLDPVLFVAAETSQSTRSTIGAPGGPEASALGVFQGMRHYNYGTSTRWSDLETFEKIALELADAHLKGRHPAGMARLVSDMIEGRTSYEEPEDAGTPPAAPQVMDVDIPVAHPAADPDRAVRLNLEYQERLAAWKKLPWFKRKTTPRPKPPSGI